MQFWLGARGAHRRRASGERIRLKVERAIISSMKTIFEWDTAKARINFEKHKISFDEAATIFTDPFLLTFVDEFHSDNEERFISIGLSERNRVLLAVHTEREEKSETIVIRIISCRKATQTERKRYEKENE
jgi:uncharacterized DUF497 family protein